MAYRKSNDKILTLKKNRLKANRPQFFILKKKKKISILNRGTLREAEACSSFLRAWCAALPYPCICRRARVLCLYRDYCEQCCSGQESADLSSISCWHFFGRRPRNGTWQDRLVAPLPVFF